MNYFLDTEFNEYGGELISLALVAEDGRELYLAAPCSAPRSWVKENVIPIIECTGAKPFKIDLDRFGLAIAGFMNDESAPTIIVDWPDDIRYFCQTIVVGPGQMVNLQGIDFKMIRLDAYPTDLPGAVQHNALWDARALRHAWGKINA